MVDAREGLAGGRFSHGSGDILRRTTALVRGEWLRSVPAAAPKEPEPVLRPLRLDIVNQAAAPTTITMPSAAATRLDPCRRRPLRWWRVDRAISPSLKAIRAMLDR